MSVAGTIRSLVNARSLQLQCTRVLHESFLLPVHIYIYGSETIWKEERSRIRFVEMDNLRFVGYPQKRELCGVMKGMDERIHEGVLMIQPSGENGE